MKLKFIVAKYKKLIYGHKMKQAHVHNNTELRNHALEDTNMHLSS